MRIRIVDCGGRDKQYPHRVQLLDLAEELLRANLPALSAVEAGSVHQPELRITFETQAVDGEERTIPDGMVRVEYRPLPESNRQEALDGKLVFMGLKKALSDLQVTGASPWSDGRDSELALRVGLAESVARMRGREDVLYAEDADQTESSDGEGYSPEGIDRRPRVERQIRERRGQREFRDALRSRYGDRCLVTKCKILAVLEAAHISPYRGEADNHPENGLLLRSDIHTLFDLDLLGLEPEQLRVELHPCIADEYGHLAAIDP